MEEIMEDPVKMKRWYTVILAVSYGMLVLGAFLIIAVFAMDKL